MRKKIFCIYWEVDIDELETHRLSCTHYSLSHLHMTLVPLSIRPSWYLKNLLFWEVAFGPVSFQVGWGQAEIFSPSSCALPAHAYGLVGDAQKELVHHRSQWSLSLLYLSAHGHFLAIDSFQGLEKNRLKNLFLVFQKDCKSLPHENGLFLLCPRDVLLKAVNQ